MKEDEMKKIGLSFILVVVFIAAGVFTASAYEALVGPTGVLKYNAAKSYGGYTLFCPLIGDKTVYLIDMEGNLVHKWETDYTPGAFAMLLENGNLLRGGALPNPPTTIGGAGGIVQEIDWNGRVVWEYKLMTPTQVQHHTFTRMPNGNTLLLAWEYKSADEAIAMGRDPKSFPPAVFDRGKWYNGFWVDFVREVDKNGKTIWEWHVWDHLGTGPNQIDINFKLPDAMGGTYPNFDWTHFNTCEYIPESDELILNSRNFSEFYIVNHKTGDIVYRWGNPSAYGQGKRPSWMDNGDQKVFGEHNVTYLGKNHFLLFDNGSERAEGNRSAVVELDRTTGQIVWEYEAKHSNSFYSYRQGAAQRLPNGNTLVTSTHGGHLFEVTKDKEIVWDYVSPVRLGKVQCTFEDGDGHNMMFNMIHRAYRYGPDYPGLKGKDLSQKEPLADCPQFYEIYKTGP
jgi:outer membrane protein assembly factor BamB